MKITEEDMIFAEKHLKEFCEKNEGFKNKEEKLWKLFLTNPSKYFQQSWRDTMKELK